MTETKQKSLYNGTVNITFYPNSHKYKLEGEKTYLVSVTSATGMIDKSRFLIPWAVGLAGTHLWEFLEKVNGPYTKEQLYPVIEEALQQHTIKKEEAADIGSMVHAYAETFAEAMLSGVEAPKLPEDADDKVYAGIQAFLDWYTAHHVKFHATERFIYSKNHGFVGMFDVLATVDGKKILIDYKTSKGVYNEMRYQLSAYRLAYEEETGEKLDGTAILHFDKETGECTMHEYTDADYEADAPVFLACLAIKKRDKELTNNYYKKS
ncbi:MAG: PD-(D/E)XK nuclease superfamily protein [Parcubacteria group bacterium ADurb.Bin192]|nr:MAG: PD-(D/E)XK nuclease superfamily protein [Parcubacteria group bacterium ADurb.Bin192]